MSGGHFSERPFRYPERSDVRELEAKVETETERVEEVFPEQQPEPLARHDRDPEEARPAAQHDRQADSLPRDERTVVPKSEALLLWNGSDEAGKTALARESLVSFQPPDAGDGAGARGVRRASGAVTHRGDAGLCCGCCRLGLCHLVDPVSFEDVLIQAWLFRQQVLHACCFHEGIGLGRVRRTAGSAPVAGTIQPLLFRSLAGQIKYRGLRGLLDRERLLAARPARPILHHGGLLEDPVLRDVRLVLGHVGAARLATQRALGIALPMSLAVAGTALGVLLPFVDGLERLAASRGCSAAFAAALALARRLRRAASAAGATAARCSILAVLPALGNLLAGLAHGHIRLGQLLR